MDHKKKILAISDIHGMYETFAKMLNDHYDPAIHQLILLGDYADRGPNSREVVKLVQRLVHNDGAIALRGNHDEWFMECAYNEEAMGDQLWHINGGRNTLASYTNLHELMNDAKWMRQNLKSYYETPEFIFVHATVKPGIPMDQQNENDLTWMRHNMPCNMGKVVVHGHTVVNDVCIVHDQMFIDTGACFKNKLSAVEFEGGKVSKIFSISTAE